MESSTSLIQPVSNSHSSEFSSVVPHLPDISIKLASTNYLLWKAQVIPILRGNGFLSYVQNQISCPSQTITDEDGVSRINPAAAMWLRTDQLILGWINSSLSDGPLSQVISSETSHDAWHVLQTLYGSHTRDRLQQMKGELQSLNKGSSSLEDYLHKAKSLALSLRGAGKPMDDDEFIICILRGLGSEFDPIVAALNARDVFPPLEGVIGKLRDFEIRLQATRVISPNVAFFTNRGRTNTKFRGNNGSRGRNISHSQTTSHQRDARFSRFTKGNPGTRTQTFTNRGGRSTGRGREGITCFRCEVRALPRTLQIAAVQSIPTDSLPTVVIPSDREPSPSNAAQDSALIPQSTPCQAPLTNTVIQDAPALSSLPTEISSHSAPRRHHSMVTRAQTGVYPPPPPAPGSYYPPRQEVYPPPPFYPPPVQGYYQAGPYVAPPPVSYPMKYGPQHHQQPPPPPEKN
uniref:Retrotransposon Copia-like N-terminal domain-containing protein n=1 Tax=Populus alba TaxID=43335 RepID=A0A4U5Q3P9_POPAL|nr:uncharacterized protein D5086_0000143280 [Populus alba]